jgi:hypothetical protein
VDVRGTREAAARFREVLAAVDPSIAQVLLRAGAV